MSSGAGMPVAAEEVSPNQYCSAVKAVANTGGVGEWWVEFRGRHLAVVVLQLASADAYGITCS